MPLISARVGGNILKVTSTDVCVPGGSGGFSCYYSQRLWLIWLVTQSFWVEVEIKCKCFSFSLLSGSCFGNKVKKGKKNSNRFPVLP